MKQETRDMSDSGINWAICKSAPCSRQITTPAPHHSSFLQAGCPSCRPTNTVKALKATKKNYTHKEKCLLYMCLIDVKVLIFATKTSKLKKEHKI